jgi:hypothetical protein
MSRKVLEKIRLGIERSSSAGNGLLEMVLNTFGSTLVGEGNVEGSSAARLARSGVGLSGSLPFRLYALGNKILGTEALSSSCAEARNGKGTLVKESSTRDPVHQT